jgi:hypothetical protein
MIPALIAAGASIYSANQRNRAAQKAAANQMAFQEGMSNTSYQRGMKDMKKAGLNPILAGKMGGASTPGGATYQPENVGMAGQQAFANVANVMANTAKTKEETKLLKRTGGSILGKTGLGIDRLLDDSSNSNVGKFVTGKSLTEYMKGTAIHNKLREFINDITNAKQATTDKPLRIRIPRRVPNYYINGTRTK